jgi:hypothetical protein
LIIGEALKSTEEEILFQCRFDEYAKEQEKKFVLIKNYSIILIHGFTAKS